MDLPMVDYLEKPHKVSSKLHCLFASIITKQGISVLLSVDRMTLDRRLVDHKWSEKHIKKLIVSNILKIEI